MYYKKVNLKSDKECFEFLSNHFTYDTMNSWNRQKSIANNVKVYNIPEIIDDSEALRVLEQGCYTSINLAIENWEDEHPGYKVGFNGRSGGYLVLYNNDNNRHCFYNDPVCACDYEDYEHWKKAVQEEYGSLKAYHSILEDEVTIVQDFDKLCDDLVALTNALIEENRKREALTRKYEATLRFQRYYYETLEDLKLHMLDMKKRGYSVYEYSDTDLYAEYEMNESIESEVVLDEEGDEDFVYETK